MRIFALILLLVALTACAIKNTHLYGSESLSPNDQAVVSAVGVYNEERLGIQITSINGKPVDRSRTASFLLPPGTYEISLHANKNMQVTSGIGGGLGIKLEEADGEATITAQRGHTYIPNANVSGKQIQFFFEDKGLNYPTECLPVYKAVNTSSNPGLKLHATGKKCEI